MTVSNMIRAKDESPEGQVQGRHKKDHGSFRSFKNRKTPSPKLNSIFERDDDSFKNEHYKDEVQVPFSVYAGAKFSEPPSPKVLPRPPLHWTKGCSNESLPFCNDMASHLKSILKVPIQA